MNDAADKTNASVVLLSGGLDSAVNLAEAAARTEPALALTFDYGQRSARREITAGAALAGRYGVRHRVVDLPWFAELLPPTMAAGPEPPARKAPDDAFWVPNRNGVFVAVAAAYAEALQAALVIVGFNAEEAIAFPDNSTEYVAAANRALAYSTKRGVELFSFTAEMTKAEILARATELNVPLELTYSCYVGHERMCGVCPSCRRVVTAMDKVGILARYTNLFNALPRNLL